MKKNSFLEGSFIATFNIVITKIMGMLYVIPFYAIVGNRGVSGSNIDLFAGSEKSLNVISQRGNPAGSNTRVEIIRVGK